MDLPKTLFIEQLLSIDALSSSLAQRDADVAGVVSDLGAERDRTAIERQKLDVALSMRDIERQRLETERERSTRNDAVSRAAYAAYEAGKKFDTKVLNFKDGMELDRKTTGLALQQEVLTWYGDAVRELGSADQKTAERLADGDVIALGKIPRDQFGKRPLLGFLRDRLARLKDIRGDFRG